MFACFGSVAAAGNQILGAGAGAGGAAPGPFGYSVGRWDGDTLEVTTTDIDWPWFDQSGIRQTEALHLVERFTPSAREGRQPLWQAAVALGS